MLTFIGLGPAHQDGLSVAARDALRAAPSLVLRTVQHPAAADLAADGVAFESLDNLYETAQSFESLYDEIAATILNKARNGDIAYAVPGHPLVAEESVRRLIAAARVEGIPFRIVGSASFIEPALAAFGLSLSDGLLLLDALSLTDVPARPDIGLLLYQIYDRDIASSVKLSLMKEYPDDWEISLVRQAGVTENQHVESLPLYRLDRVEVDHLTAVYVPPLPKEKRKKIFADLVWVMSKLRGENGCPWDREQDHRTLRRYMLEECCEAVDAIDADDMDELCDELGDVLLQVVFHAQLETETGVFTIDDVINAIVSKLLRRHPHVFGQTSVRNSEEVLKNWDKIKRSEKGDGWRESILDGVPASLPALMRALEISKRVVKVGFEWEKLDDVVAKLEEEVSELKEAISAGDSKSIGDELGDLLFTAVNVARWHKIDPEATLREMLLRFSARFRYIEKRAAEQVRKLDEMKLAEMDSLWDEAKRTGI